MAISLRKYIIYRHVAFNFFDNERPAGAFVVPKEDLASYPTLRPSTQPTTVPPRVVAVPVQGVPVSDVAECLIQWPTCWVIL